MTQPPTLAWLGQFPPQDQALAIDLLRAIRLVSRDEFAQRMRELIELKLSEGREPIGLYAEREVGNRGGVPHRLFKERQRKVRRAYGPGPRPVSPMRTIDPDVGSEGIVAQLISELCRIHPRRLINHPGPDQIRTIRLRRFIIVTDFIGTGKRAVAYLRAAWKVRSVRSWWSTRSKKGISFEVAAYAATEVGRQCIEAHPSRARLTTVAGCPTVNNGFSTRKAQEIKDLCARYSPSGPESSLGFGSIGALIVFAHGVPNNSPAILHAAGKSWTPLFPARVTSGNQINTSLTIVDDLEILHARLVHLREQRIAESAMIIKAPQDARRQYLVMAALKFRPRTPENISIRTGLTILEVQHALSHARSNHWIQERNLLTDLGRAQLSKARQSTPPKTTLCKANEVYYYPKSLRAPRTTSR